MNEKISRRLIVVSNRLPFQLIKVNGRLELRQSDGGLVSALMSYFENASGSHSFESVHWIGSADFNEKNWEKHAEKPSEIPFKVDPIFIDKAVYSKFYNGFCNATLWPLFHYFPSFVEFDNETFTRYEEVNQLFADRILSVFRDDDIVWVHDYQLMLLPAMLRKQTPEMTIGFFLHIPFPSFEVFRLLHRPWKRKIIGGLLGADLIGFHTHEYVQDFLKAVRMIEGHDHQFRSVFVQNRTVRVEMFPLGIDFPKFHNAISLPEVIEQRASVQRSFPGKKIIFSVDRLDYTKGITHRLSGFERFLESYPEWREKVVFVLVVVPSRQVVSKYNERKKLIEEEIGRINGMYSTLGWQPIIYRYNNLSSHELSAMYNLADIGLITPLRDGMNLVAKEYVASSGDRGVLILSELAGAAKELGEAILVNPTDREDVSQAIHSALVMPPEVQQNKIELLQRRLKAYTVDHWMSDFLTQLNEVKLQQRSGHTLHFSESSLQSMADAYRTARKRLLLLDYDGTLVPFSKHPGDAIPDPGLIRLIHRLSKDKDTDVTIISGRDSIFLERWLGDLPVSLVSEHGAGVRLKGGEWGYHAGADQSWKPLIKRVLEVFTSRSPGSFIEEKKHTLVWHYRNVETALGFSRSREVLDYLHHMIRNSSLHIIDGNKVIEVRISGIDKGAVAREFRAQGNHDFILAIGDDKTDEDMFRILTDVAYTIKVGSGHTSARYRVSQQKDVLGLLNNLVAEIQEENLSR